MSRWTAFLVFSCFSRPLCSGYWQVRRGRQFLPMFPLCFSQIQSSSSWSGERSCGNPDLLMISSYSCTVPLSWPKWHARRWSLISPVHSESFINLAEDSLQTEASLVSKKHLHAVLHLQAFQYLSLVRNDESKKSIDRCRPLKFGVICWSYHKVHQFGERGISEISHKPKMRRR